MVNVSCSGPGGALDAIAAAGRGSVLDVHTDADHNRSVLTLAGPEVEAAARRVATEAVARLDLRGHEGVHPRIGVLDVVPFVPLGDAARSDAALGDVALGDAVAARDAFAAWAAATLGLPCFLYGPERSLPEIRRRAWVDLLPDVGPAMPHPTAGAAAVGARRLLVAYNVWLAGTDVDSARAVAAAVRGPHVRALGLAVRGAVQVSMNLVDPLVVGPDAAYDAVAAEARALGATVARAELVGLVPRRVLQPIDPARWSELDLAEDRTIEARLGS